MSPLVGAVVGSEVLTVGGVIVSGWGRVDVGAVVVSGLGRGDVGGWSKGATAASMVVDWGSDVEMGLSYRVGPRKGPQ